MHPFVAHGDAVADAGNAEKEGVTAAGMDPLFDETLQFAHAGMTGDQVGEGGSDTNERAVHGAVGNTGPLEQSPVRSTFEALGDGVTAFGGHRSESFQHYIWDKQSTEAKNSDTGPEKTFRYE
jgi:hypothetical protein